MSVKKFKFVSPGVFINEIDNSQLPATFDKLGPVIIGRTERGPSMRPVRIESFSEFINVFGNPIPGGQGGDVWRDGNYTAPTYAAYSAQAWLRNSGPCTVVRLLGIEDSQATTAGKAGWQTENNVGASSTDGGAYGLFIIPSGTAGAAPTTGSLAAVFYLNEGGIYLNGALRGATTLDPNEQGTAGLFKQDNSGISSPTDAEWKIQIDNSAGNLAETITFNFNRTSQRYIRKVFNTNPTLLNSTITTAAGVKNYFLGQTFERTVASLSSSSVYFATIVGLEQAGVTPKYGGKFRFASQPAKTGWIFGQDLENNPTAFQPQNMQKLFRLVALDTGEWDQRNLKVSIQDITAPTSLDDPYGAFTVVLRKAEDNDGAVQIVERYSNCSLNPNSVNYIARKIGDRYLEWDTNEERHRVYGNYANTSKFVRVEMNQDVDAGSTPAALLPFGFYGPPKFKDINFVSGTTEANLATANAFIRAGDDTYRGLGALTAFKIHVDGAPADPDVTTINCRLEFPEFALRSGSVDGTISSPRQAYFGIDSTRYGNGSNRVEDSYPDLVRTLPDGISNEATSATTQYSFVFTLDDLSGSGDLTSSNTYPRANYQSGSRASEESITSTGVEQWKTVLQSGFGQFTMPLVGGFDGVDITEKEPFRNTLLDGKTSKTNYAYSSIKRAIDTVKDPEVVEFNLATVPGLTNQTLNEHLITTCESRGDALAIIDLKGDYVPAEENNSAFSARVGNVDTTVTNLLARGVNSSYGCAYYPWVQIRDDINNSLLWAPPSVVALGVMASGEKNAELWFAPAGFTRGGLTDGAAGVPVVSVAQRLTSKDRDKLYDANINPIATFPAEGIVVFGQKTLQVTPSALDRINVRRLLIYVKKEISRMAATTLFQQNVQRTWNHFLGRAEPFLRSVQVRLGLDDFKVVLDETTTTPDLVDRNIMYAKIFLKPTKAIEFIALDFVITDSGASFED